jgi:2-desacetyl-2-hydroxyethyl bacteriochlorophyllide A dehydrogenase
LQVGAPEGGFIPGYAAAGRVLQGNLPNGTRVCWAGSTCASLPILWGGHLSHAIVNDHELLLVPEAVSAASAAFAQIGAIAHRGCELSQAHHGDTVMVLGLGLIGLSSALLHTISGARVIAIDRQPERTSLAQRLGLKAVDSLEAALQLCPDGADVVVDASGVAALLPQAISLVRQKGWLEAQRKARLVVQGSYAGDVLLPYDPAFMRELELIFPRNRYPHNVAAVLDHIAAGRFPQFEQFGLVCPAEDAPQVYQGWLEQAPLPVAAGFVWH